MFAKSLNRALVTAKERDREVRGRKNENEMYIRGYRAFRCSEK